MSSQPRTINAPMTPRDARALRNGRQPLTIAEQAERAERTSAHGYRVPSSSLASVSRTVNVEQMTCSCPGWAVARKHKHPCRHLHAVLLKIAGDLLAVEGSPAADDFVAAIGYVERGQLAYRYICDGACSPHYGKVPNRAAGVEWSIGLRPDARRELSPVEKRACVYALRAMAEESQWQSEPAERAA